MKKLAIFGGVPVNSGAPIKYSSTNITEADKKAVCNELDGGWIAGRSKTVAEFEEKVAEYTGYKYAIAVNSATSGLFLQFAIRQGSGVVDVPALTFVATMNAPLLAGWNVNIVGVNPRTFVMHQPDYYSIPVSYAGYPVAESIVTDDAQSFRRRDKATGTAVISTHGIKNIATGEGGVVLTNCESIASDTRQMSDHGHQGSNYGHNFRMSSIQAALGLSQLSRADSMQINRANVAALYRDRLATYSDIIRLQEQHELHSNHLFPIILNEKFGRNWFRMALKAEGVLTQVHYKPLHLIARNHIKRSKITYLSNNHYPTAMAMWSNGLSLPIHNDLSLKQAELVMDAFDKIMDYLL